MACRGSWEAVLPVPEISAAPEEDRNLRALLKFATDVTKITVPGPPEASYEAASREVVLRSDLLVAVWDGSDEGLRGGTAETVAFAREHGTEVRVVWPDGALRLPPDGALCLPPDGALRLSPDGALRPPPDGALRPPPDGALRLPPERCEELVPVAVARSSWLSRCVPPWPADTTTPATNQAS